MTVVEGLNVLLCGADMVFNRHNIQRAVWNVRDPDLLGGWLDVPGIRRLKIQSQFPEDRQRQLKEYINYFMNHNPLASWRSVVVALDGMVEKEAAEMIRHLAEPVTGEGGQPETV